MPYSRVEDLPEAVRNALPDKAQELWLGAFNGAMEGTCKDAENPDGCAAAIAWTAVKSKYDKPEGDGQWQEKPAEAKEPGKALDGTVSTLDGAEGQRIFGLLSVKAVNDEQRIIEGYATLWQVKDEQDEIMTRAAVEPYLAQYMKDYGGLLRWQHGNDPEVGDAPIGRVLAARCDEIGLWVRAQVYKGTKAADQVWNLIKQGVRGFSVGARSKVVEKLNGLIKKWPLREISITHIPALAQAQFNIAKALAFQKSAGLAIDQELLGASPLVAGLAELEAKAGRIFSAKSREVLQAAIKAIQDWLAEVDDHERQLAEDKAREYTVGVIAEVEKMELSEMQTIVAKSVADALVAQRAADVKAADEAKKQEDELNKRVDAKLAEAMKSLADKQPILRKIVFPTDEEKKSGAIESVAGPYDHVPALDLAMAFMVGKSLFKHTGVMPSQNLYRALHGKVAEAFGKGLWAQKSLMPEVEGKSGTFWKEIVKPMECHPGIDNAIARVVRQSQPDELYKQCLQANWGMDIKANELMGTDVSTAGSQWVPAYYSRELIPLIRNEAKIQPLFRAVEVQGSSLTVPLSNATFTWYKVKQTDSASEMVLSDTLFSGRTTKAFTGNVTLTPVKIGGAAAWTGELSEQSLVDMGAFLREELVLSSAETVDKLLISGHTQTGATNISDYANGAIDAGWVMLAMNGLRYAALVSTAANSRDSGALTIEDFLATKKLMGTNGNFALEPGKLVWIPDSGVYWKIQSLGEVLTADKFGGAATVVNGVVERLFGSPVVTSDQYGLTNASGYIHTTPGNNTLGSFMCVRPDQARIGWGRRVTIESERVPLADSYYIVAYMMISFATATDEYCGLSFNVTV